MDLYSGNGDKGMTNLAHTQNVSKADDRIRFVGTMDELISHLALLKNYCKDLEAENALTMVNERLKQIVEGVKDPYNREYKLKEEAVTELEQEMEKIQITASGQPLHKHSALEANLTRAVARRAESSFAAVSVKYGADVTAKKFMNRLSDYLEMLSVYLEEKDQEKPEIQTEEKQAARPPKTQSMGTGLHSDVLKNLNIQCRMTLDAAKYIIEKIEEEAKRRGKRAVIAICGPDGNPIAVHVMDGAFLVSFDVAVKKAYTSAAVQMPTIELRDLTQPGGTFYGLDKMEGGNIIIFGGGVPIKIGETIIGGLGVSGGTGEEDHSLAEYGLSVLAELFC